MENKTMILKLIGAGIGIGLVFLTNAITENIKRQYESDEPIRADEIIWETEAETITETEIIRSISEAEETTLLTEKTETEIPKETMTISESESTARTEETAASYEETFTEIIPERTHTGQGYVLNTNTKKIHLPDCSSVKDILPKNYAETNDYEGALSEGYVPCKRCLKN